MSVLKPRNRLVNFRLSEEEFETMKVACVNSGARSLSDFARGSVLQAMDNTAQRKGIAGGDWNPSPLNRLDGVITTLESRVEQILRLLEAVQPGERVPTTNG